jgi:hypothetical protein
VSLIIAERPPRVNPAGPKKICAPESRPPDPSPPAPPKVVGFVRVPHDLTASGQLSDRAFRALVALQRWTWRGQQPTNHQLAQACGGWSVSKAKRALGELEAAGHITRVVAVRDGRKVRERIDVHGASPSPAAPEVNRPSAETGPPPGPALPRPGGPVLNRSEDSLSKIGEDSQEAEKAPTTTMLEKAPGTARQTETVPRAISPALPSPGLTEGQAAFLVGLGSEERARFEALPGATRAKHLEMLRHGGDAVILAHVMATLRPPAPQSPIPTPEDPVPRLLESLASGNPNAPMAMAGRLAREFGDRGSYRFYLGTCDEVLTGQRAVESLESAYRQATGPKAKSPAKVFTHAVNTWDAQHGASVM